ncbi:hypothetical protein NDU88_008141 [Pleurodeles waltl]|uniref:Uncharacterized protein n=1 Tax=Pleurodeles waltl TaxID=8319 RepID=A0AAV7NDD2_PLEWA|nr:hypothetical protein NDU88_008141 [Pleurodeles waltl]
MTPSAQRGDRVERGHQRAQADQDREPTCDEWIVRRGPEGVTVFSIVGGGATATSRPPHPAKAPAHTAPVREGCPGGKSTADGAPRRATWGPCPPQVSAHSHSPRQRAVGSGQPERPVQALTQPESAPAEARDPCAVPARGESHRRATQGATPRPGAVPTHHVRSGPRAAQTGHGQAGGLGARESRSGRRLPAPPSDFPGVTDPAS